MKYFLLVALVPLMLFAGAQDGAKQQSVEKYPKVKWRKKLKIARLKIKEGSYYNAAQYLEDVYKDKPNKIEVPHLLGWVYQQLRDYEAAEKYYKAEVSKDPGAYPNDGYFLGQMQKMQGKYDDARKSFDDYLKAKLDKGDKSYKALAKMDIVGCDTAQALIASPTKVKVEHTEGINTTLQDNSPKPLKGARLMFAQQGVDTAVDVTTSKRKGFFEIYTADKQGKVYGNKTMLPTPPNSDSTNVGNAILSSDENTLIYTQCNSDLLLNRFTCKLYRSKKNGSMWGTPEELKDLNYAKGTTTQPAWGVAEDGSDLLYFVSDRGGKDNLDIWYAKMNSDGTFGSPTSAGDVINTGGDEVSPYYDKKNKALYFSSTGHPSLGGLDVFKVYGTPGKWSAVQNAGVPINSSADDFYLALDDKGAKGFMVSNRPGTTSPLGKTCCDDIWTVIVQHDVFLKAIYVKRGDPTNTPVTGVDASLYKVNGNNFEFVQNAITNTDPFVMPLIRNTSYKINGNKEGFWPAIDNFTVSEDEERDTINQIFYIDPVVKKKIRIPNVYFAFDKSNVITFYQKEIDSVVAVLNANPGYTVEVQGHTDSKGTDEYNEKLSMRRADEVKTFLIKKKGIAENRVVAKWFGESKPAQPNELPNGEDDPEGRAHNRRVEFKIIPDKPDDAPDFENYGDPVKEVKTGPGFTYGIKKK